MSDATSIAGLPRGLLLQIFVLTLATLQFGLHLSELNTIIPYMGCKGVEGPALNCLPGLRDGSTPSAIYAVGGFLGSFLAGAVADARGRRQGLLLGAVLNLLGTLPIAWGKTVVQLSLGRFIVGICAGQAIVVVPMFISEIAPPGWRGRLGASTQVSINVGIVLIQTAGWLWAAEHWRRVVAVGVFVAAASLLGIYYAVESPIWLYSRNRASEAVAAAAQLGIDSDYNELQGEGRDLENDGGRHAPSEGIGQALRSGISPMVTFMTSAGYRPHFLMVAGVMVLQQYSGINAIVFYGVPILQDSMPKYAGFVNLIVSVLNLLVTLVAARLLDTAGRKPLLILSLSGLASGTALMGFALARDIPTLASSGALLVVSSFALGLGPIPFLLISELVPSTILGAAQSVGTAFNWIATFTIGKFFPALRESLGPSVLYIFTACNILGAILIHFKIPETA